MFTLNALAVTAAVTLGLKFGAEDGPGFRESVPLS